MHGSAQVDRASGDLAGSFGLPEVQPGWVPRDDIVRLLDLAFHQRVTIVVAPAGYGKTTLLTQWAASHLPGRVRWLSVTDEHNGSSTMGPAFLSALAEAIEETAPIALVMDDFQRLAPVLALEIAELIDAAPDTVHLVVVTRQHPPLPFYRVGLSDLQVEIGPDVLAFADDVGAELLHRVSDRGLTEAETAALLDRAEGWPAGLAMAGDDTRIASYFDEQVLRGIPADMYEFLRTTCVLQELDGSLCDFLTGRPGGDAMLDALSERSLFIARSGEGRSRWRYHPLFSARLRDQLHHDDPVLERRLLLRAAEWHLAHDEFAAGMGYLVEAGAWNEALTAAFEHGPRLLTTGEPAAVARWLAPVADNLPAPRVDCSSKPPATSSEAIPPHPRTS